MQGKRFLGPSSPEQSDNRQIASTPSWIRVLLDSNLLPHHLPGMADFDLKAEILRLKQERNAVILAHSYQRPEIQDIADFVGDSLALAYKAQETDCDVIAFCGVHFMAETAKILNPGKTVILPDMDAGCSLAASCPAEDLETFLREQAAKNYYVVAYVNCSIGVKALADVIVTSGNAAKVVAQAPADRPILFVPDQNLGSWVMEQLNRPMALWNGSCHVHMEFTARQIQELKSRYPEAALVCHPECTEAVRLLADHICSTEKMIPYCRESAKNQFIIVTEVGILHRLRKMVPDKEFISTATPQCSCSECSYMKMNTLEKLHSALQTLSPAIELPEELRQRAEVPLLRMLELSR